MEETIFVVSFVLIIKNNLKLLSFYLFKQFTQKKIPYNIVTKSKSKGIFEEKVWQKEFSSYYG